MFLRALAALPSARLGSRVGFFRHPCRVLQQGALPKVDASEFDNQTAPARVEWDMIQILRDNTSINRPWRMISSFWLAMPFVALGLQSVFSAEEAKAEEMTFRLAQV